MLSDEDVEDVEKIDLSVLTEGTKVLVKHFDTTTYAKEQGLSIEMAARKLRYEWFAQIAQKETCQAIAVAHHQNDQAETILLNLKRGTGIRGLCGMRAKSLNPEGGNIPVIRPLLCTTRDYIEHYLRDIRHLPWVEDSTNKDTNISRNAVRHQLTTYSKAEIEHIAATAEHMQGYVDWLESKETKEAGRAKLHEELREYGFGEIDKMYDALRRGIGGKTFRSATHQATIKKGKVVAVGPGTTKVHGEYNGEKVWAIANGGIMIYGCPIYVEKGNYTEYILISRKDYSGNVKAGLEEYVDYMKGNGANSKITTFLDGDAVLTTYTREGEFCQEMLFPHKGALYAVALRGGTEVAFQELCASIQLIKDTKHP